MGNETPGGVQPPSSAAGRNVGGRAGTRLSNNSSMSKGRKTSVATLPESLLNAGEVLVRIIIKNNVNHIKLLVCLVEVTGAKILIEHNVCAENCKVIVS